MNAMHSIPGGADRARPRGTRLWYGAVLLAVAISLAGCSRDDPAALLASAKKYIGQGDFNASVIQLKNVLKKDPKNAEARYLLGLSLLKNGDPGSAKIELNKAIELGLDTDKVEVALARAELASGGADKVVAQFGPKTLSQPKMQAELRAIVGMAQLARNRQKTPARRSPRRWRSIPPTPPRTSAWRGSPPRRGFRPSHVAGGWRWAHRPPTWRRSCSKAVCSRPRARASRRKAPTGTPSRPPRNKWRQE